MHHLPVSPLISSGNDAYSRHITDGCHHNQLSLVMLATLPAKTVQILLFLSFLTANHGLSFDSSPQSRRTLLAGSVQAAVTASSSSLLMPSRPSVAAVNEKVSTAATATLSDGSIFPLASFGLQIYDDDTAYKLTMTALEVGYRNFFASVLARNQRGFAKAVKDSGVPRQDLYICGSVVSNRVSGFDAAKKLTTQGWLQNMEKFAMGNIDYLDQIMLDYPGPDCESIKGQWASFEDMYRQKLVRSLSVSNFSPPQIDCVLNAATVAKPVVNQLPFSVAYHPGNAVDENRQRGGLVQAWAPLGGSLGGRFTSSMKGTCGQIGKRYHKSFAQVALRWIIQSGGSFTTQSKNKAHFTEDLDIFDFQLTEAEMTTLSGLA